MRPLSQQALELQQPQSVWDTILEIVLIALLAFAPAAMGAREPWSELCVLGAAAGLALLLALKFLFSPGVRFTWTWSYVPIVLFLAFAALQLAPLPSHLVGSVSPATVSLRSRLLGDLPDASSVLGRATFSLYPLATRHDLRLLLAVVAVFVVVVNVYRRPSQIKRLLTAIAVIGSAVALFAVYQNLTGTHFPYRVGDGTHPNSGPFANHSHFGQFMNLCIGAMLALILVRVAEVSRGAETVGDAYQQFRDARVASVWVYGLAILLCALTVFLSMSRGAVVAMLIAGALTGLLFAWRRAVDRQTVLAAIGVAVLLVVLLAGFGLVFERLASLRQVTVQNGDRLQVIRDLAQCWRKFPVVGTGLGTHQYVFPMFDRSTTLAIATHAENEYAQLMEECGGIGVLLCLVFVVILVGNYFKVIWKPRRSIHLAAFGLGFGLLAILIHSFSDFGQHVPADALLAAVYCGLLVALTRLVVRRNEPAPSRPYRAPTALLVPVRLVCLLGVGAVFLLPMRDAMNARNEREAWDRAMHESDLLQQRGWATASFDDFKALLRPAAEAARIEPDDAAVQCRLASFRWRAINSQQSILPPPQLESLTRRIIADLEKARVSCPTYGSLYSLQGVLEQFVLKSPAGAEHIRTGYGLDKCDPISCTALVYLQTSEQRWNESLASAHRALSLDAGMLRELILIYIDAGRPDLAYTLVRGNREGLESLAQILENTPDQKALADRCRSEARQLVLAEAENHSEDPNVLAAAAVFYAEDGNDAKAIECYEKALSRNYNQVDWRFHLAQLLIKTGQVDKAVRNARICLRLRPGMKSAEELIVTATGNSAVDR